MPRLLAIVELDVRRGVLELPLTSNGDYGPTTSRQDELGHRVAKARHLEHTLSNTRHDLQSHQGWRRYREHRTPLEIPCDTSTTFIVYTRMVSVQDAASVATVVATELGCGKASEGRRQGRGAGIDGAHGLFRSSRYGGSQDTHQCDGEGGWRIEIVYRMAPRSRAANVASPSVASGAAPLESEIGPPWTPASLEEGEFA
ncbi:hypothetical protein D9611_010118 [Ephemerocybe angulata]|uniref:Uncharacterized protein n=1 Tax=Ephemerocybe angulata TaxID=980116 RepID=A0A8H5AZ19_9AGAR|nr:hypothetical protein D9611_010118 [Tulosesus angulatus]